MEDRFGALYDLGQRLVLLRDPQQIAEAVLEIVAQVLKIQDSDFLLVDEGRNELYVTAREGELCCVKDLRLPLDGEMGITVVVARSGKPLYVPDVRQDPRYVDVGFPAVSELAVPVQIEDRVLGVINVESAEFDAFVEADREMLCILANHAALALENARLHAHEQRKIEELAILNDLSRRISASLDLQETLDAVVASASELIPCALAEVSLWDAQTGLLTLQAIWSEPDRDYPVGRSFPPGEGYTGWVVLKEKSLLVPDVETFMEFQPHLLPGERPFKSYAGVPLLAGDTLVGTLVLVANEIGAFDQDDLRLLQSLANQAAIAIRNAQLYQETSRRGAELKALNSVAEAVNRSLDLETLLNQTLEQVIEITSADAGSIRLIDTKANEAVLYAQRGFSQDRVTEAHRLPLSEDDLDLSLGVGWVARTGQVSISEDLWIDPRISLELREHLKEEGHRSLAQIPLQTQHRVVGMLGVMKNTPNWFNEEDIDLLNAIGQQIGVAVENAQLRQKALNAERFAAVGRVATSVAHDLRSPLGGIIRSAEFLARPELSPSTREKLSQAIVSLAQRLNNTSQQILDYVQKKRLPLRCESCRLSRLLEDVLTVLEVDFSDRGIEVIRNFRYPGELIVDSDRFAQVVYNIAANARDAMPQGGKFTVSTRKVKDQVEMRFSDTGPGVPMEVGERIFEPFYSFGKRQGAGLGLAIAQRIVEEHGGSIRLESKEGKGAEFLVTLPI